ncbi:MAG TPA: reductive dehalogenase domain-containing protein [Hyphomicrobiales bacterium]|nr:Fe-S protein [Rhodobiaceae bacterium]HXK53342.1 reductive dehalogenase domain-containing protein [Hyphomicrobiales bacterium]
MLLKTAADKRPYHLGTYPLETLPRDEAVIALECARAPLAGRAGEEAPQGPLARAARTYRDTFAGHAAGDPAPVRAPVPDDLARRAVDIKGYGYFLNADQVGICQMPASAWLAEAEPDTHGHAIVLLIAHGRVPEEGNPARALAAPAIGETADMRATEIAVCVARHIRVMGFSATAHAAGCGQVDRDRLAVLAGLCVRDGATLRNPFVGRGFSLAVVTTGYELPHDLPLAATALKAGGLGYWLGVNGATSGRERGRRAARPTHLSAYPMETVKRVERPTTLILDDEIPRVPKRAAFFERALRGDLGAKAQRERNRFAFKQPHTYGILGPMRDLVPMQDGEVGKDADTSLYGDPEANSRALKSLSYLLGSDLTGICEIPSYAWYSHNSAGEEIVPYHRYAVVMLTDQEYDTMEGASGDDWISGAQSMRAYLRGAEIAGIMADVIRQLGFPARAQTNVDSDVLQLPLTLWSGLGELSRIGELVLNPFVGPRFKSVVLTTDMPLQVDKPIDFGLQYFCNHCWKCARECPCDAIPWGNSVMFNGYEMFKIDAERCARYRLTNSKGSACGRCMKMCPLNKVVTADGPLLQRMASWCGIHARWLKPLLVPIAVKLDDWLGHGTRNAVKKWWLDLEIVDNICVDPVAGTNERDLNLDHRIEADKQKMAYYFASMMPVPNDVDPQPVDRKAALAAASLLETPAEARARKAAGGARPAHYVPTPPAPGGPRGTADASGPSIYSQAGGTGRKPAAAAGKK